MALSPEVDQTQSHCNCESEEGSKSQNYVDIFEFFEYLSEEVKIKNISKQGLIFLHFSPLLLILESILGAEFLIALIIIN